jgi:hypothetical protein
MPNNNPLEEAKLNKKAFDSCIGIEGFLACEYKIYGFWICTQKPIGAQAQGNDQTGCSKNSTTSSSNSLI